MLLTFTCISMGMALTTQVYSSLCAVFSRGVSKLLLAAEDCR